MSTASETAKQLKIQRRRDRNTPRVTAARRAEIRQELTGIGSTPHPVTLGDTLVLLDEIDRLEEKLRVGPEPVLRRQLSRYKSLVQGRSAVIKAQGGVIEGLKAKNDALTDVTEAANRIAADNARTAERMARANQKLVESHNVLQEAYDQAQVDLAHAIQEIASLEVRLEHLDAKLEVVKTHGLHVGDLLSVSPSFVAFSREAEACGDFTGYVRVTAIHKDRRPNGAAILQVHTVPTEPAPRPYAVPNELAGADDSRAAEALEHRASGVNGPVRPAPGQGVGVVKRTGCFGGTQEDNL